jgi:hypothetical protein
MSKLLEVRCCCQSRKLLGWLPAPYDVRRGMKCYFVIKPEGMLYAFSADFVPRFGQLTLSIELIRLSVSDPGHLAFKAEDTSLDVLRRVGGFKEYKGYPMREYLNDN